MLAAAGETPRFTDRSGVGAARKGNVVYSIGLERDLSNNESCVRR